MPGSVYKVIELVGTSDSSWEDAAKTAVAIAGKSLRDLRIAEVTKLDMQLDDEYLNFQFQIYLQFYLFQEKS